MKVQFQVSASSTATAASTFHVMGGWPANPAEGNGSGWQIAGKNYFTNKFFDPDNLAFPAGVSLADYRDPATTENNPRAQKRWLGVVDFDFPLEWDGVQRRFSSATQTADLVVLGSVQRQVRSLTPSTAEITFGAKLDIPNVNTQSLTAAVKEGISGAVADALTDALGGPLKEQLGNGISRLDGLLCERIDDLLLPPLEAAADPLVDAVLAGDPAISQLNALRSNLATLPDLGLQTEVDNRLQQGISGIDAALSLVGEAGNRQFLGNLVRGLLERSDIPAVAGMAGSAVDAAFASVLPEIEPDLEQAREVLLRARGSLVSARTRLHEPRARRISGNGSLYQRRRRAGRGGHRCVHRPERMATARSKREARQSAPHDRGARAGLRGGSENPIRRPPDGAGHQPDFQSRAG